METFTCEYSNNWNKWQDKSDQDQDQMDNVKDHCMLLFHELHLLREYDVEEECTNLKEPPDCHLKDSVVEHRP